MAMNASPETRVQALLDLETRHDELFRLLSDLEKRVATVLAECQGPRQPEDAREPPEFIAKAA